MDSEVPEAWDFSKERNNTDVHLLQTLKVADKNNLSGNAHLLDESHFGWKIADCSLCHNENKDPNGHGGFSWPVNHAAGFNNIQPYYCATCHGNNGAPEMHSYTASCFWCHSQDKTPSNHGEASAKMTITKEDSVPNKVSRRGLYNRLNADFELYDDIIEGKNNFYSRTLSFPDPYSCATCHQKSEIID